MLVSRFLAYFVYNEHSPTDQYIAWTLKRSNGRCNIGTVLALKAVIDHEAKAVRKRLDGQIWPVIMAI
jgi:hypothetical protein